MDGITEYILGWNLPALICLLVGLMLMVSEMFTPGMGLMGALGGIALVAAIVLRADTFANGVITLAIILVLLSAAAFFVLRSFKRGLIAKSPMVLNEAIEERSTPLSSADMQALVGLEGVCLSTLRPAGNAEFGGRRFDVMSEGEFIQKGSRVRIERVEGLRILVKKVGAEKEA